MCLGGQGEEEARPGFQRSRPTFGLYVASNRAEAAWPSAYV